MAAICECCDAVCSGFNRAQLKKCVVIACVVAAITLLGLALVAKVSTAGPLSFVSRDGVIGILAASLVCASIALLFAYYTKTG